MQTLVSFKEELCGEDFNSIPFIMLSSCRRKELGMRKEA